jgi:hypothetical protein
MYVATKTGQKTLARAVAMVAHDAPGGYQIFREWSMREPEVAAAIEELSGLPPHERLLDRTRAMKPFKAHFDQLVPTKAERAEIERDRATQDTLRQQFWGFPQIAGLRRRRRRRRR